MACCECHIVADLRSELDRMHHKLNSAENQISACKHQEIHLEQRNKALQDQLHDLEKVSHDTQLEKDKALATCEKNLTELKQRLNSSEVQNKTFQNLVDKLEKEKRQMNNTLNETKREAAAAQEEVSEKADLTSRLLDDKKRLAQRIEKLTANERVLVLEIERHRRQGAAGESTKKLAARANQVEVYMAGVEQDRDYYKGEVEFLGQLLSTAQSQTGQLNGMKSTLKNGTVAARSPTPTKTKASMRSASPTKKSKGLKQMSTEKLKALEEENNRLLRELETFKSMVDTSNSRAKTPPKNTRSPSPKARRSPSPKRDAGNAQSVFKSDDSENVASLKKERDDLKELLNKLEQRVREIQENVRLVTKEKEHFCKLYNECRQELVSLRQENLNTQHSSTSAAMAAKNCLQRTEAERDSALEELRRTSSELEALMSRYQCTVDSANDDKFRAEKQLNDLRTANTQILAERDDLLKRANTLRDRTCELETKLTAKERECAGLSARMQRDGRDYEESFNKLRSDMAERDHQLSESQNEIRCMREQLHRCETALQARDKEFTCMQDQLQHDLVAEKKRCEALTRQKDAGQNDIHNLTRENQNLQRELQETAKDRAELYHASQQQSSDIQRLEKMVDDKDAELADLLSQYRNIVEDVEGMRSRVIQLQENNSNLRSELDDKKADLTQAQDELRFKERTETQNRGKIASLEVQTSSLKAENSDLNDKVNYLERENDKLQGDISALRDLSSRLEDVKVNIENELQSTVKQLDESQNRIDDLESEIEILKEETASREEANRNLEESLQNIRDKQFKAELDAQEQSSEVNHLRDRLSGAESRISQNLHEIESLKTRNCELEREAERLHRALAAERFEKDRLLSEMRIQSLVPPYTCPHPQY